MFTSQASLDHYVSGAEVIPLEATFDPNQLRLAILDATAIFGYHNLVQTGAQPPTSLTSITLTERDGDSSAMREWRFDWLLQQSSGHSVICFTNDGFEGNTYVIRYIVFEQSRRWHIWNLVQRALIWKRPYHGPRLLLRKLVFTLSQYMGASRLRAELRDSPEWKLHILRTLQMGRAPD